MTQRSSSHLLERLNKLKESMVRPASPEKPLIPRDAVADPLVSPADSDSADSSTSLPSGIATMDEDSIDLGSSAESQEGQMDGILGRLQELAPEIMKPGASPTRVPARNRGADASPAQPAASPEEPVCAADGTGSSQPQTPVEPFFPMEPKSFRDAGLNESVVEELVLKYLLNIGENTGHGIAEQVKLPFPAISELLSRMKFDQLLQYRGTTYMNDYVCSLTEMGRERARRQSARCTYFGAAPVTLEQYRDSVAAQTLRNQNPTVRDLERAFSDLLINPNMLTRLGAAMNSGKGMFLYGYPGNGKTSIAERVTRAFGEYIWIPRAIGVDGEIIRLFDPTQHEEAPLESSGNIVRSHKADARWVRIRRPTIIVGGELTLDNLELSVNHATGINEAPVQLKSNCGTLVIDDFGRQRMSVSELLNRWIVPLEKRVDYLNLPSGKKVEVPFDQLVVFSTNLEPKDLVDDAFLRRIPYKINVENPTEADFRKLFQIMCPKLGIPYEESAIAYLIQTHYQPTNRPFRCCHPRDLLFQIQNYCKFVEVPVRMNQDSFDFAADNYFSMM